MLLLLSLLLLLSMSASHQPPLIPFFCRCSYYSVTACLKHAGPDTRATVAFALVLSLASTSTRRHWHKQHKCQCVSRGRYAFVVSFAGVVVCSGATYVCMCMYSRTEIRISIQTYTCLLLFRAP